MRYYLIVLLTVATFATDIEYLNIGNEIRFEGDVGSNALIQKSNANGRDELMIYAGGDAYKANSRGAGIQMYGNNDIKHDGIIAFLTGLDEQGDARMIISERGNITIGTWLWNFVDSHKDVHLVNIVRYGVLVAYITVDGRYVHMNR